MTVVPEMEEAHASLMIDRYSRDGFCLAEPVLPPDLVGRALRGLNALVAEEGYRNLPATTLRTITNAHLLDPAIHELVSHHAIGRLAAAVTGASMVQVFVTQGLIKPPGGAEAANVGWHQDLQYWQNYVHGEMLTVWIALSDVDDNSGPVRFIAGSHKWGLLNAGDFCCGNLDAIRARVELARPGSEWEEVAGVLKPGGVSLHHNLTIHGSGSNLSSWPRNSVAVHLRTERSKLVDGVKFGDVDWLNDFADPQACPVIYRREPGAEMDR